MAEEQSPRILLVDDEEMILSSLKSLFVIESDYALLTYTSPQQALKDIDEGRITRLDLVISDYLMAEMDGMTFLTKVKEHFPHTPRILLTRLQLRQSITSDCTNTLRNPGTMMTYA